MKQKGNIKNYTFICQESLKIEIKSISFKTVSKTKKIKQQQKHKIFCDKFNNIYARPIQ